MKKAIACDGCNRVVWDTDVTKVGKHRLCCFCAPEVKVKERPPAVDDPDTNIIDGNRDKEPS